MSEDLSDSQIIGKLADNMFDMTQEDTNELTLKYQNQRDLLEKVSSEDTSIYELNYLFDELKDTETFFWSVLFKEIIKVYSLNTLKRFATEEISPERILSIQSLLICLKISLKSFLLNSDQKLPETRDEILDLLHKNSFHQFLILAIETIDNEDLDKFKKKFKKLGC